MMKETLAATLVALAALGCEVTTDVPTPPAPVASAAAPAAPAPALPAPAAPATPTPPPVAGGDLTAARIAVPLADLTSDALRAALEAGGWQVGSATATRSSMLAISVTATKGDAHARISYYRPGDDFWERRLQQDNAAIHHDGDVLLGVVVEGNPDGARTLLGSLVGAS